MSQAYMDPFGNLYGGRYGDFGQGFDEFTYMGGPDHGTKVIADPGLAGAWVSASKGIPGRYYFVGSLLLWMGDVTE